MKTRTFRLNKLVRDNIVQNHLDEGAKVASRKLKKDEKTGALVNKIIEEITEGTDLSELADVQEALDQLIIEKGFTKEEVATAQAEKRQRNGGFEKGDYIETETWPAGHKWAEYYAADPNRFPEITTN
jgi:predicted house-cleaning noncanonical NTP pyrophosphatase (MazG superfamily)